MGESAADRARLWSYRERHPEAAGFLGVPIKLDVSVPAARWVRLASEAAAVVTAVDPGAVVVGNGVEVVVVDWLGMELEGAVPSAIFPGLCVDAAPFVPALPQAASTMAAATSRAPPVSRR